MKRLIAALVAGTIHLSVSFAADPALDYAFRDEIPLDGDWEMAYSPHFLEVATYPEFRGHVVKGAITVPELAAWIDTPPVKTTANPNRAMNPGDPSAYVRIRENIMP